jgi:potassium-dependent mechanosensitive channel
MRGCARLLPALKPALALALAAMLAALLAAAGPAPAQTPPAPGQPEANAQTAPDYVAWEAFARRAEATLQDTRSTNLTLEQLRSRIVEWRARFQEAQSTNQARIATLRGQLAALGPPPEEGATEAPEIAERRRELNEQLARLQAPVVAAEEAFRRADGMIREIDRTLRERQADALIQLSPAPINPAYWPGAVNQLTSVMVALGRELVTAWADPARRNELNDRLPLIGGYLLFALVLLARGRRWMEQLTQRLQENTAKRSHTIWSTLVSLGQIALPLLGVLALVAAIRATGMVGLRGQALVAALPMAGFTLLAARWLGLRLFPRKDNGDVLLNLPPERRREGRFHAASLGLVLALDQLRRALFEPVVLPESAASVLAFPLLVLLGVLVFRVGQLMRLHLHSVPEDEAAGISHRLIGIGGRLAMALGAVAPVLAAVGYMTAAEAVLTPAVLSLGLVGLLIVLQRLLAEIYAVLMGGDPAQREALVPVLAGFLLVLVSLPAFALIWGVREAELLEMWERFREGITLGDARISPNDFLTFLLVFVVGFAVTRLIQGALRSSVLPKTKLDKGGQTAIVSGLGYFGIFLAAVIAFSTAGIDLTSLALVAGALSVGIGFGLQTVVSNFVSGIILLFERPVAEGDWIEVGGVMGTVRRISVRSTVIETFDRTDVIVPNADLISGMVTNWTRFNLTGRLIVKVGVAYGTDTRTVEKILYEIAEEQPLVVLNPPPTVLFRGFGADALEFEIRVILRDVNFILRVHSDINHAIARRFAEAGIEIPFAQRDIWLRNPEALHPQVEAVPMPQDPDRPRPAAEPLADPSKESPA